MLSSNVRPPSNLWSREIRKMTGILSPTTLLIASTISFGKRAQFSGEPPYSSVLLFHTGDINWSIRYPACAWISIASNPASLATPAANLNPSIIWAISSFVSAWQITSGLNTDGSADAEIGGFPNVSGNAFRPVPGLIWQTILAPYLWHPSHTDVREGRTVYVSR